MIGKIIVQLMGLWAGWVFATYLSDLKDNGDRCDLHQVRARHDYRREMKIAARRPVFSLGGYALFLGQCGLLLASIIVRDPRTRGRLTIGSLACVIPITLAVNLLLPQFNRSKERYIAKHYRLAA